MSSPVAPSSFDHELDYSSRGDDGGFWFDFIADVGDGWDSTYAMARLLALERIALPAMEPLPRGSFVVMEGDEVYPVASAQAYQ